MYIEHGLNYDFIRDRMIGFTYDFLIAWVFLFFYFASFQSWRLGTFKNNQKE